MLDWIQNNIIHICGLFFLGIVGYLAFCQNPNKKKFIKKHNCFKKCRPVFENMKIFDQQLEEKKYSGKAKDLVIFQVSIFSSIIESKKKELCSKHYREFKELNGRTISLVEIIDKKHKELFNYYKHSNCSCKKVLEKIFEAIRQAEELKDNEKIAIFDVLLKENRESFCDNHRNFYENFSNFHLSRE